MKSVLVIGGGFGGLEAAIFLKKYNYDVTLVSDRDYFFIYPTSIWIPTREKEFDEICIDLAELQRVHGFKLIVDALTHIDVKQNRYTLASGEILSSYDHVVLAMGASKLKHEGIEHTLSICAEPEQSLKLRDSLDALIEKGSGKISFGFGANPKDSSSVRGGPAFELLFNTHNLLKKKGIRDNFELSFFAPMSEPGKRMGEKALSMMDDFFKRLAIKQHFGKKIKLFKEDSVIFEDDSKLESDLIMFIAAGSGHEVVQDSHLPKNEAGFVKIDEYCRVIFDEVPSNIYAIGDIAALEGPSWKAKQGHLAEIMARNVAFNISQTDKGKASLKSYKKHINILCLMDSGDGASLIYRDDKKAYMIPLPFIGHYVKKLWGVYAKLSKLGKIPRILGL
ncbi:sulfide-quinone reductase [Sulfurimonas hongkongensis]|uniref:Sulfide-quinone reductase n=1 Tax=Sulfurimonas hongkongensis TaxID=1172190 RepID=T0L146_9BACT|nr:FAD-dependent oxidoreductase [Sulfurimonas hongkongensis]EQB39488.1 sulfide-quinone reductase [Sulfurimonas hongkongensis]